MTKVQEVERQGQLASAHYDYHKSLNAYAFFKLSDSTLGQDLVQDTFVKTWTYLMKKGEIQGMKSFLYHVLNNLIVDEYRKRKRKTVSLDVLLEAGFAPDTGESESNRNQNISDGKGVMLLIEKLPETYRQVVRMRDERPLVKIIEAKLEKNGFDVVTARTVEQGLGYIKDIHSIDAVWLDHYLLGEQTGIDFVVELKKTGGHLSKIPVFVVSNTASNTNVQSYMRLGVTSYSVKAEHRLDQITESVKSFLNTL